MTEIASDFTILGSLLLPYTFYSSVQFSHSVVSDSLRPHEQQHARPPCPSPTPRVYPNSCSLNQWFHLTISSCHPLLLLPSIFSRIRVFSNESALCIRWPKYWSISFKISPSMNIQDWFSLGWTGGICVQSKGLSRVFSHTTDQKQQFFVVSFLDSQNLTSIHDHWKNYSLD